MTEKRQEQRPEAEAPFGEACFRDLKTPAPSGNANGNSDANTDNNDSNSNGKSEDKYFGCA